MLSKKEYENLQRQLTECNCTYEELDPRIKRKGAAGTAHSQLLRQASTKEMILHDVASALKDFPEDRFHIEFDGIAGFTIMRNDTRLLSGSFYEVERCYQDGYDEFRKKLIKIINGDASLL